MVVVPPVGAFDTGGEPHPAFVLRVVDKFGEARDAPGLSDQPRMQTNIHHSRMRLALIPKIVKATFQQIVEIAGTTIALRQDEPGIVVGQRIRHDQMLGARDLNIVGQVVVVGIGIVDEPTLLD